MIRCSIRFSAMTIAMLAVFAASSPALGQAEAMPPAAEPAPAEADPNKMADQAMALVEAGDMEAAAAIIDRLRRIAPRLDRLNLAAARLLVAGNKTPQALLYYEQYTATPEGKNDYRPYSEIGRLYLRSNSFRLARRYLEQARQFAPEQDDKNRYVRAEIMIDLANVHRVLKDPKEAVRIGREAATQAPNDPRIQIQYSQLLLVTSPTETKEARDVAARAVASLDSDLRVDPINESKLRLLRDALSLIENTWASEALSQKGNPEPVYMLSIATHDTAEISLRLSLLAAREYAERAVTLNDAKPEYRIRLAEIEALMGSTRTALEKLDNVLKADPENAEALALKARIASSPARKIGGAAGL